MRYRVREGVHWQAVADEIVLLDSLSGKYYGLNRTAAFVWRALIDGTAGPEQYATKFGVTIEQANRDFEAVSRDLLGRSFIVSA